MSTADPSAYDRGLEIRKEVLGAEYVERALAEADDFSRPMQELVTEYCWGATWGRPGLDRRTRSLVVIAMMAALRMPDELAVHVKSAAGNGATEEEIQEVLLQAAVYAGVPAALLAQRTASAALRQP